MPTTRDSSRIRASTRCFLATPTTLHAEQMVAALEAGKHVFSESRSRSISPTACASRRRRRSTRVRKR
jgi:hypothetical protein